MVSWLLLILAISLTRGEYYISYKDVPSYLYHEFDNVEDAVFPGDIRINVSLSRMSGTLFYSIDKLKNQIIVSLHYDSQSIDLEFGKENIQIPISKLCECKCCLYTPLDIRIITGHYIQLQCNGGAVQRVKYEKMVELNKDYPIPFNETDFNTTSSNTAHMWLVNHPKYNGVSPNNKQLSGCIHRVLYQYHPIIFSKVSDNIRRNCSQRCTPGICNGGQCLETYNDKPVCNCTMTFLNGRYCNDTIRAMNITSINSLFQFDTFKLSWKSSSNKIFALENQHIRIRLSHLNGSLVFEYWLGRDAILKYIVTTPYVKDSEYIFIAQFYETSMDVMIFNNGSSFNRTLYINYDLRKEVFTSLTLRSGKGMISMYYKDKIRDYVWTNVSFSEYELLRDEQYNNEQLNTVILNMECIDKSSRVWTAVAITSTIFFISISIYVIMKRKLQCTDTTGTHDLDDDMIFLLPGIIGYE